MPTQELTRVSVEPIALTQARLWCRIPDADTSQDAMLLLIIAAARRRAEDITGLALSRRTFQYTADALPLDNSPVELAWPPLVSIDSFNYYDPSGTVQSLAGSPDLIIVDTNSWPGRIAPLANTDWPSLQLRANAVTVQYTAGFKALDDIPEQVRLWMQVRTATWFDMRDHIMPNNMQEMSRDFVDGILDRVRAWRLFA
jgi:uncharacterized phiE125 gp8 family phage protein